MKVILLILNFIALFFTLALPLKTFAISQENILSFDVQITINQNSVVEIQEEIKYFFPSPKHGINRIIPNRYWDESKKRSFQTPIEILSIKNKVGDYWKYSQKQEGNNLKLKIGNPDEAIEGEQIYIITYKISGVVNYFDDHDELYWNVTGHDWPVTIQNVAAAISLPDNVNQESLKQDCYTGPKGSLSRDCNYFKVKNLASFESKEGPLTIVLGWNKNVVQPIERAYEIQWRHESIYYWLITFLVFLILLIKYFRTGRDPKGRQTIAPEFEPSEGLKPGEMGTLLDEKADRKDISATIVDLAVRGYLKINQKKKKYTLIKLKDVGPELKDFEKMIFNNIFAGQNQIDLDDLHTNFSDKTSKIEDELYNQLIERNYFIKNPEKIRDAYFGIGIVMMIICWGFFWLAWHLVAALLVAGIMVIIFARAMPKKTREGVIIKEKILGFKEFLYRAERYRVQWQEKENTLPTGRQVFEKYLPYALVFGIADKWAKNFAHIYKQPPNWYEGDWTTFNSLILANSLNSFSTTASSSFSPPAASGSSGFGGGGSSGGGFGGGGGGSW